MHTIKAVQLWLWHSNDGLYGCKKYTQGYHAKLLMQSAWSRALAACSLQINLFLLTDRSGLNGEPIWLIITVLPPFLQAAAPFMSTQVENYRATKQLIVIARQYSITSTNLDSGYG